MVSNYFTIMKKYRNIYFLKGMWTKGNGSRDIKYYGTMYSFSKQIKDFDKKFDKNQDLIINCTECMKNKIGKFIKVKR